MNKKKFTYKKSGVNINAVTISLISFHYFHQKKRAKKSFQISVVLAQLLIFQKI